jgi:hypothetical protein
MPETLDAAPLGVNLANDWVGHVGGRELARKPADPLEPAAGPRRRFDGNDRGLWPAASNITDSAAS